MCEFSGEGGEGGEGHVVVVRRMMEGDLGVLRASLLVPTLTELRDVLQAGLAENFEQVDVSVVDCPDLQLAPFCLAAPGLCGDERIADVGGVPYLLPEPRKDKLYDLRDVLRLVGLPGGLVLGAGAASHAILGTNAELMANILTPPQGGKEAVNNRSFSARWDGNASKLRSVAVESVLDDAKPKKEGEENGCVLEPYNHTEFALLANLFISQGKQGKVLEVRAGVRTGASNFISCLRLALFRNYGEKPVGLGGVFVMEEGEAKLHVMPHFSSRPLHSDECLNSWLKFITVPSPLSCLSVLVSHDPALSLRLEHTHCFGPHGLGGHYHCDVTPRRVHYHGYFIPARDIYRIDRPT